MELQYSESGHIRYIKLIGKLDIVGVNQIDVEFSGYCSGEKPLVIVDLSSVDFMASIGSRMLTMNAKSIATRGGKLALLNPSPEVKEILEITGIPAVIPMYEQIESAQAVLLA